jgi:type I restriction enzyme, S subunit
MMNKLPKYPAYKPSGVDWLGEIPEHWECIRMKHLFRDHSEKNKPEAELLSVTQDQGVVPRTWVENRMVMPSGALESFKFIRKGDFAISLRSFEGGLEYCYHDGIISPAYTVLKVKRNFYSQYYKYLFKSSSFISELQTSVVGIRQGKNISYPELSYSFLPIPTFEEQTIIAEFLDRKTTLIDQAIGIKQKQIELLKERRQLLIHRAVTRGIGSLGGVETPDVKLKDSGVEWIGEIPEHWEVKPLRFIGKTQNGISKGAEYFGTGFPFVNYSDAYRDIKLPSEINGLADSSLDDRKQYSVIEGDVFFTRTSETIEEIGFSSTCLQTIENATFSGFLIRFRPHQNILKKEFAKYYFSSKTHRAFFVKEMNLVIRASLSQDLLKKMPVLIPPIEEQNRIAVYLDSLTIKISTAISLKEQEIEKLKEYKASLINEVVTGKIKVN